MRIPLFLAAPALVLFAGFAAAQEPIALEINLFQGYRPSKAEQPSPPLVVYLPPDPGWSDDVERQRQQIADTLGLEGASVLSLRRMTVASGAPQRIVADTRPTPYAISIRPVRVPPRAVELEVRIAEGKTGERELASASVAGELGKTFILGGKPGNTPIFVAVTPRDPQAGRKDSGLYTVDGEVTPPRLVKRIEPSYPMKLREQGKTGLVVIQAVVATDGSISRAVVVRHSEPGLDDAALEAVRQWKYQPATLKGKAVQVYLTITVSFRMD